MHANDSRIYVKNFKKGEEQCSLFEINEKEVLRYCGYMGEVSDTPEFRSLLDEAYKESEQDFTYKVCYRELSLCDETERKSVDFLFQSENVKKLLEGCSHVVLMAATIGIGIDTKISRYAKISPAKALVLQGLGAERIESLCDYFCDEYSKRLEKEGLGVTARYSPGYGDLPLIVQKDFFQILDIYHMTGISLSDNLFMKPSKSVTALFGIKEGKSCEVHSGCDKCGKTDCEFRK